MGVNSLPKTVTQQRCDCDLNPGLTATICYMFVELFVRSQKITHIDQCLYSEIVLDACFSASTVHEICSPDERHKIQVGLFVIHFLEYLLLVHQHYPCKQVSLRCHIHQAENVKSANIHTVK